MNVLRWCSLFMVVLDTIRSQTSQSISTIEQLGTDFIPANPAELIESYTDISTFISCHHRCLFNSKCRTIVSDTTWPFVCRLYESSIDTGTIISASSSTSRVGSFRQTTADYSGYNQTCNSTAFISRQFLICTNGLWRCPDGAHWNGSICLCNSTMMIWNNLTCSSYTSMTSTSTGSTNTTSSTLTTSTTTSTTTENCSQVWQQCGGQSWSGPTCCIDSTCTYSNSYYSQCQPTPGSSSSSTPASSTANSTTAPSNNTSLLNGTTTRYWDCCKPSCGWPYKASVTNPVQTCATDGVTPIDMNTQSGCNSGTAYTCDNQQPWSINNTFAYGYVGVRITTLTESDWCCACYSLIFTSGPVVGKEMIVQATNTGGDLGVNHFDLQMPGGGMGYFSGCLSQYGVSYSWGQQYGGVSNRSDCANLPLNIQNGCYWRFDWFMNADNPNINFKEVPCPSILTSKTSCVRN